MEVAPSCCPAAETAGISLTTQSSKYAGQQLASSSDDEFQAKETAQKRLWQDGPLILVRVIAIKFTSQLNFELSLSFIQFL